MNGFGKYLIKEYGWWILYLSWIISLMIFAVIGLVNIKLWFIFVSDLIGGFIVSGIFILYDKYVEYNEKYQT